MITQKGRKRLARFITNAQKHLQWLRMRKWELEQKKETSLDALNVQTRIQEVSRDIDLAYKRLS